MKPMMWLVILLLVGCVRASVVPVGAMHDEPLVDVGIRTLSSDRDIRQPFEVLGLSPVTIQVNIVIVQGVARSGKLRRHPTARC